ncbi:MAG: DegQ family serine endoprotease [bacterium]
MKLPKEKFKGAGGRVSPAAVLVVVVLLGLAAVVGIWYGENRELSRKEKKPALPEPKVKEPLPPSQEYRMVLEDRLVEVAEGAMPAVVNVFSEKVDESPMMPFFNDPFFRFFHGPEFNRKRKERSLGSGVIVSEDGYILSNAHVIKDAESVRVMLSDKREFQAEIVGNDPKTDIGVLKIDSDDLPVLKLADSDKVKVGQVVLAIGNPFGLSNTVTMGIVSARGRSRVGITDYENFIQTDAAINPGNSGGALINLNGEVVGINTAIFSRSGGHMGVGFAVPANLARHVLNSLIEHGEVRRGFLGVSIQQVTPGLAEQFGLESAYGALVAEVIEGTPADEAGLEPGDVIVSLEGKRVRDSNHLRNMIAEYPPDSEVELTIVRDGKEKQRRVELMSRKEFEGKGQRPGQRQKPEEPSEEVIQGMKLAELTPRLARKLGVEPGLEGVAVMKVKSGSRADMAGLRPGDVIVGINRKSVSSLQEAKKMMEQNEDRPLLLRLRRQNASLYVVLPP